MSDNTVLPQQQPNQTSPQPQASQPVSGGSLDEVLANLEKEVKQLTADKDAKKALDEPKEQDKIGSPAPLSASSLPPASVIPTIPTPATPVTSAVPTTPTVPTTPVVPSTPAVSAVSTAPTPAHLIAQTSPGSIASALPTQEKGKDSFAGITEHPVMNGVSKGGFATNPLTSSTKTVASPTPPKQQSVTSSALKAATGTPGLKESVKEPLVPTPTPKAPASSSVDGSGGVKKKGSKKKLVGILGLLVLVVGLTAGIFALKRSYDIRQQASTAEVCSGSTKGECENVAGCTFTQNYASCASLTTDLCPGEAQFCRLVTIAPEPCTLNGNTCSPQSCTYNPGVEGKCNAKSAVNQHACEQIINEDECLALKGISASTLCTWEDPIPTSCTPHESTRCLNIDKGIPNGGTCTGTPVAQGGDQPPGGDGATGTGDNWCGADPAGTVYNSPCSTNGQTSCGADQKETVCTNNQWTATGNCCNPDSFTPPPSGDPNSYCAICSTSRSDGCECIGNYRTGMKCKTAPPSCADLGTTWQPDTSCEAGASCGTINPGDSFCPSDGSTPAVWCATFDCPQGDTNGDNQCTLQDSGARQQYIGQATQCPDPASGCGQVDIYKTAGNWDSYCGHTFLNFAGCTPPPTEPPPTRPAMCSSSTISAGTLSPSNPTLTVTMNSSEEPTAFSLAFYNLDNLYGPGNPKPLMLTAGTHYVMTAPGDGTKSHTFTVKLSDFEGKTDQHPDNTNTDKSIKNVQVNGYFVHQNGNTSQSDPKCVQAFTASYTSAPPSAPACEGMSQNITDPKINDIITFTCTASPGANRYEFQYMIKDSTGTTSAPMALDPATPTANTSKPLTIGIAGLYTVQCRPCTDQVCANWEATQ